MNVIIEFFQRLHHLDELIRWGGYTILAVIVFAETGLFVGFFLPGDSLLVTAGVFAGKGDLDVVILMAMLSALAIIGDAVGYWTGRSIGPRLFNREKSLLFAKDHLMAAKHFFEKYGGKAIVFARFIPVVRTFTPVVAGVGEMPYSQFFLYNVVGGVAWVCGMLTLGFFLGRTIPDIDKKIHWIILLIIIVSFIPAVIEFMRMKKAKAAA
jgi:membrane-associated protein